MEVAVAVLAQVGSLVGVIVGVLVVCALLLWGVAALRKRLREPEQYSPTGFTLADLRQLHRSGQMSDQEFERAKEKLLGSAAASMSASRRTDDQPSRSA
jgi:hypothetical protein